MNKNDRRYVRTKRSIKRAFAELLLHKPFEKISINEISERADINRSTFYLHYVDKYALMEEYTDDMLASLYEQRNLLHESANEKDRKEKILAILNCFYEERDFFSTMFSPQNSPYFSPRFKSIVAELIRSDLSLLKGSDSLQGEFDIQLRVSAISGVIEWWLTRGNALSVDEIGSNILKVLEKLEDA